MPNVASATKEFCDGLRTYSIRALIPPVQYLGDAKIRDVGGLSCPGLGPTNFKGGNRVSGYEDPELGIWEI